MLLNPESKSYDIVYLLISYYINPMFSYNKTCKINLIMSFDKLYDTSYDSFFIS